MLLHYAETTGYLLVWRPELAGERAKEGRLWVSPIDSGVNRMKKRVNDGGVDSSIAHEW